jgi:hypothetical protein
MMFQEQASTTLQPKHFNLASHRKEERERSESQFKK